MLIDKLGEERGLNWTAPVPGVNDSVTNNGSETVTQNVTLPPPEDNSIISSSGRDSRENQWLYPSPSGQRIPRANPVPRVDNSFTNNGPGTFIHGGTLPLPDGLSIVSRTGKDGQENQRLDPSLYGAPTPSLTHTERHPASDSRRSAGNDVLPPPSPHHYVSLPPAPSMPMSDASGDHDTSNFSGSSLTSRPTLTEERLSNKPWLL